jgi:hypothetical protein
MPKKINITGTCYPALHYMADTSAKLKAIMAMVEAGEYFSINRPRQYGKTTMLTALAEALLARGGYQWARLGGWGDNGQWGQGLGDGWGQWAIGNGQGLGDGWGQWAMGKAWGMAGDNGQLPRIAHCLKSPPLILQQRSEQLLILLGPAYGDAQATLAARRRRAVAHDDAALGQEAIDRLRIVHLHQ